MPPPQPTPRSRIHADFIAQTQMSLNRPLKFQELRTDQNLSSEVAPTTHLMIFHPRHITPIYKPSYTHIYTPSNLPDPLRRQSYTHPTTQNPGRECDQVYQVASAHPPLTKGAQREMGLRDHEPNRAGPDQMQMRGKKRKENQRGEEGKGKWGASVLTQCQQGKEQFTQICKSQLLARIGPNGDRSNMVG